MRNSKTPIENLNATMISKYLKVKTSKPNKKCKLNKYVKNKKALLRLKL